MKKLVTLTMLLLGAALFQIPVHADPATQSVNGGRIARALNLTDAQKTQLKPLLRSTREEIIGIRNDSTLTPDQKRQKLHSIWTQTKSQINQILTPEQQQELDLLRQQARARREARQRMTDPLQ